MSYQKRKAYFGASTKSPTRQKGATNGYSNRAQLNSYLDQKLDLLDHLEHKIQFYQNQKSQKKKKKVHVLHSVEISIYFYHSDFT